jgi:hypothetical protein
MSARGAHRTEPFGPRRAPALFDERFLHALYVKSQMTSDDLGILGCQHTWSSSAGIP